MNEKTKQIVDDLEKFLMEAWCIDGEVHFVGFVKMHGVDSMVFNLQDAKRGEWSMIICSKPFPHPLNEVDNEDYVRLVVDESSPPKPFGKVCSGCNGTGKIFYPPVSCPDCDGTGEGEE